MLARIPMLAPVLLVVATFAGAWMLVLGWWQASDHAPTTAEIGLYLFALPLSLSGGFWFLRRFFDMLRTPTAATAAAPAAVSADSGTAPGAAVARLHVGTVAIAAPHAADPPALLAAIADNRRPQLDPQLCDGDGYPILAARAEVAEGDIAALPVTMSAEARRALALLDAPLRAALAGAAEAFTANTGAKRLSILWSLPAQWPPAWQAALRDWLAGSVLVDYELPQTHVHLRACDSGNTLLHDLAGTVAGLPADTLLLVCACTSNIGEATVARWLSASRLYTTTHTDGLVPGEAAAAVLCASSELAAGSPQIFPCAIGAAADGARTQPPGGKRGDAAAVTEALMAASTAAGIDLATVTTLYADSAHHAHSLGELLNAAGECCPAIGDEDCAAVGTVCGSATPADALVALACACAAAADSQSPALCVSHTAERRITAVAVLPSALAGISDPLPRTA